MLNVGRIEELAELYAGQAGVTKERISPKLLREMLIKCLRRYAKKSDMLESKSTISSTVDQMEYELPSDAIHILKVHFDGKRAHKVTHHQQDEFADEIS